MYIRHLTVMQIGEPICDDAHGEQSGPGDIPATASCHSERPDIQTLLPFWPNWNHQIKPRGTLYHVFAYPIIVNGASAGD